MRCVLFVNLFIESSPYELNAAKNSVSLPDFLGVVCFLEQQSYYFSKSY